MGTVSGFGHQVLSSSTHTSQFSRLICNRYKSHSFSHLHSWCRPIIHRSVHIFHIQWKACLCFILAVQDAMEGCWEHDFLSKLQLWTNAVWTKDVHTVFTQVLILWMVSPSLEMMNPGYLNSITLFFMACLLVVIAPLT